MELFKALSKNKAGKLAFYIFEIASAAILLIGFIMAIYSAAVTSSFAMFITEMVNVVVYSLLVYGLGRLIDLGVAKLSPEQPKQEPVKEEEKKEEK